MAALEPDMEQATCRPASAEMVSLETQTSSQSQAVTLQTAAGETL